MKQIKKFRKNDWSDEEFVPERRNYKKKKFDRALKIRDIEFLSEYDED